jgi:hypothetical protein
MKHKDKKWQKRNSKNHLTKGAFGKSRIDIEPVCKDAVIQVDTLRLGAKAKL